MPKFNHAVNSFTSGEVTPRLHGRTELREYNQSLEECRNFITLPQGGARRRMGTQYLETIGTSNARQIPFIYSKKEVYIVDVNLTGALVGVKQINADGSLTTKTVNTSSPFNEFTVVDSANRYTAQELTEIQYAQNGDVLVLVHPNYPPMYVVREQDGSAFRLTDISSAFFNGLTNAKMGNTSSDSCERYPFRSVNIDTSITFTFSALTVGTSRTITAGADVFESGHVGSAFIVFDSTSGNSGWCIITAVASATSATCRIVQAIPANGKSTWHEMSWNDFRGWPRSVCFFDGRLIFGGTFLSPDTIWGSQSFDIFHMTNTNAEILFDRVAPADNDNPTPDDGTGTVGDGTGFIANSDPFQFTSSAQEINEIQWMVPSKNLFFGTAGREYIAPSGIGPLNVGFNSETGAGSGHRRAFRVDNTVMFVQRSLRQIMEMVFNRDEDSFAANDISLIADHILDRSLDFYSGEFDNQIREIAYSGRDKVMWVIDELGTLFGITKNRPLGVLGWHHHVFAGSFGGTKARCGLNFRADSGGDLASKYFVVRVRDSSGVFTTYHLSHTVNSVNTYSPPAGVTHIQIGNVATGASASTVRSAAQTAIETISGITSISAAGAFYAFENDEIGVFYQEQCEDGDATHDFTSDSAITSNRTGENSGTPKVRSIALIPSNDRQSDDLYVLVERTVNGSNVIFRERVNREFLGKTLQDKTEGMLRKPNFLDAAVISQVENFPSGTALTAVSGLSHLEGETVYALADGQVQGPFTVASGAITLNLAAQEAIVGLNPTCRIKTLSLHAGSAIGSSQGQIKRIDHTAVKFHRTAHAKIGRDADNLDEIPFRDSSVIATDPTPLFTGEKDDVFNGESENEAKIVIQCDSPLPCEITSIIARGNTNDG